MSIWPKCLVDSYASRVAKIYEICECIYVIVLSGKGDTFHAWTAVYADNHPINVWVCILIIELNSLSVIDREQ